MLGAFLLPRSLLTIKTPAAAKISSAVRLAPSFSIGKVKRDCWEPFKLPPLAALLPPIISGDVAWLMFGLNIEGIACVGCGATNTGTSRLSASVFTLTVGGWPGSPVARGVVGGTDTGGTLVTSVETGAAGMGWLAGVGLTVDDIGIS